jgi:hypothetical protein
MRGIIHLTIAGFVILAACHSPKTPNKENFANAINQYLAKHGQVCTVIGRQFPVDLPRSEKNEQFGIGAKLAALERAGLLHSNDTTAVVHGMLDPLRGSTLPQPVKRYELTADGERYFQQILGTLVQSTGFCFGQKSVDAIVKWTEPVNEGTSSGIEVTYTYKISDIAPWAQRTDVQQAFADIRTNVTGASNTPEVVGLQLTSTGWEVPGQ